MSDETPQSTPPEPPESPEPPAVDALTDAERPPPSDDPVMAMLAVATAGEYRIERELGRGGMATVYLAHDLALDRRVAIKVMSADLFAAGDVLVDRFLREARTGARLNHPHIIPVYAIRQTKEMIFFVMKFIDGKPLDGVIEGSGQLPIALVARVMAQVSDALAYAHRNGIIHRDIKPGNVMLDKEGWVVLTDLGIAKVQDTSMLTATGTAIGTPTYMSPEQSTGSSATTGASDQYSLGCVAFEMITGRPPFSGESVISLIFQHHAEPPPPIHRLRPDCPADVAAAVARMLQKAPEDRYGGMEEVAQFFREFSGGDEEEDRLLLRAFATGTGVAQAANRINTPRQLETLALTAPSSARATPRPSSREVAVGTTSVQPVRRAGTPRASAQLKTAVPTAPSTTMTDPGALKAAWPRSLIKPPERAVRLRRFRVPSVFTLMVGGALGWFFFFPRFGALATSVPSSTALMLERQGQAEAAVRRGQAPGAEGSCEGIRNDLPNCRKLIAVPLAEIAPVMSEAVVIAQDSLFNVRQSSDWAAMRMAAGYPRGAFEWSNSVDRSDLLAILPKLPNNMGPVGRAGSLTQRLVSTIWFPPNDGLFRKAREIAVANRMARQLPKERILELYLNVAEFGAGLYGVEAAAQAYFRISAKQLNKWQAATLAATLATPRTSTPTLDPAQMQRRQALILRRLNGEAVSIPSENTAPVPATRAP